MELQIGQKIKYKNKLMEIIGIWTNNGLTQAHYVLVSFPNKDTITNETLWATSAQLKRGVK